MSEHNFQHESVDQTLSCKYVSIQTKAQFMGFVESLKISKKNFLKQNVENEFVFR